MYPPFFHGMLRGRKGVGRLVVFIPNRGHPRYCIIP